MRDTEGLKRIYPGVKFTQEEYSTCVMPPQGGGGSLVVGSTHCATRVHGRLCADTPACSTRSTA